MHMIKVLSTRSVLFLALMIPTVLQCNTWLYAQPLRHEARTNNKIMTKHCL